MLARLVATTTLVALSPSIASAETPFADYCEGNICFQRKVRMECMRPEARALLREIANRFGKIEVASVCDGRHARRSAHYVGKAIDFRPFQARREEVVAFLKAAPNVGGVGTYSNGLIHADVADRKMAWHGSGRGRVVWPIGAGTIEKAPGDPASATPTVTAAFAFPFNLFGGQSSPGTPAPQVLAAAAPTEIGTTPLAAKLPPLPPRRPVGLRDLDVASVQVASTDPTAPMAASQSEPAVADPAVPMFAADLPQPALRSTVAFEAVAVTSASVGSAFAPLPGTPIAQAARLEVVTAQVNRGFAEEQSPFSTKALAPKTVFAARDPSLISASLAPY